MYFSHLREDLRKALAEINPIFSVGYPWRRSHYIIMADIINLRLQEPGTLSLEQRNDLGGTISHATLKRFFENNQEESTSLDLRFLKSMDKLSIFLGFDNFTQYSYSKCHKDKFDMVCENSSEESIVLKTVEKSLRAEFRGYASLPDVDVQLAGHYFAEECPVRARVSGYMAYLASMNLRLVQEGKRSNYELLDIKLVRREKNRCIVETTEFWNLLFESQDTGQQYTYNHKNIQTYILINEAGTWLIWDNYNPDVENIKRRMVLGQ